MPGSASDAWAPPEELTVGETAEISFAASGTGQSDQGPETATATMATLGALTVLEP